MNALLLVLCIVFAVAAAGIAVLLLRDRGPSTAARIAALEESHGIEQQQGLFVRFVDEQQQRLLGSRFLEAGWRDATAASFVTQSLAGGVAGFVAGMLVLYLINGPLLFQILVAFTLAFAGFYYPTAKLDGAIRNRKKAIQRNLPDVLDIVSSTVQAGVALNGAIAIAAEGMEGALAEELRYALQDIRLGRARSDALMAMSARVKEPTLGATVSAIVQADKLGGDIASVLDELATDARDNRLMRAEEAANALPNKLVFPMALFMLPALFVVIFGSLAANILSHR
jgi:tight adherence protein C